MDGFVVGPKENKLGIRGSDTHSLMFQDVKVPKENRIGDDGFGFSFAMKVLSGGTNWNCKSSTWESPQEHMNWLWPIQKNEKHLEPK